MNEKKMKYLLEMILPDLSQTLIENYAKKNVNLINLIDFPGLNEKDVFQLASEKLQADNVGGVMGYAYLYNAGLELSVKKVFGENAKLKDYLNIHSGYGEVSLKKELNISDKEFSKLIEIIGFDIKKN